MPLVFSPPPRLTHEPDEFSTGSAQEQRPACHSRSPNAPRLPRAAPRIGAAVSAAVLLLSACTAGPEEHTLATPTTGTPTNTAEAVPEYTTDLQLSEEEKKAVDASLIALNGFVETTNDVYGAGGSGAEKFDKVSKDVVLVKSKNESDELASSNTRMHGEFRISEIGVNEVDLRSDDGTQIPFVSILACVPTNEYYFAAKEARSNQTESADSETKTFQFVVSNYESEWFVSEQYLWSESCESK
ncbi:hypothetical protein ACUXNS_001295 [Brevibacterium pityocampae]